MTLNQFLRKYKKVIIIVIVIVLTTFIFNTISSTQENVRKKVENYIKYNGFKLDDDKVLYKKEIESKKEVYEVDKKNYINTSYETLYFDIYSYNLIDNLSIYYKGIESNFVASKNWKYDTINYTFSTYYADSNIIFSGDYNNDSFTCNIDYEYAALVDNTEDFCNDIKSYAESFDTTVKKTFRSMKIIDYMKNNKEE